VYTKAYIYSGDNYLRRRLGDWTISPYRLSV